MSTPLTDAINALTTYANSVTGASDTTLSDAVDTLVDGYGGGGGSGESGTISVTTDTLANLTIPVSALYSHILVWDANISGDADLTGAPYGSTRMICEYGDVNTGFFLRGGINSNGTGFYAELSGIGRWGSIATWNNRIEFTASTVKLINPRLGGISYPWINGHTLNWYAW